MASLKDKVILITGSGDESGIGAATALYMVKFQPKLVLTGRDDARLKRVGELCKQAGLAEDRLLLVLVDVAVDSDLERLVETTLKTFQQLDVLVNNAGVCVFSNVMDTSMADYDKVMNINVRSPFYLTQLCLPHLIKTKGCIINMSSISAAQALGGIAVYATSKAALNHLTEITAMEVAAHGVRVNSVNPGAIVTDIYKKSGFSEEQFAQSKEHWKQLHPLGRPGCTTDVAKAVVFLASDDSSFTTGHHLYVDGGMLVKA